MADQGPVGLLGDGRFVFAQFDNGTGRALLIDDQTGRRTPVHLARGCSPAAIGGGWLLVTCRGTQAFPSMRLYQLSSPRHWRPLAPSHQLVQQCSPPHGYNECAPTAIGRHWIRYGLGKSCLEHCPSGEVEFQNIDNGSLANDPESVGGHVIADLNSPRLEKTLCPPLRVPPSWPDPYDERAGPGTVTPYGQFAVSFGTADEPGAQSQAYLEKCRSQLHLLLQTGAEVPPTGSVRASIWSPNNPDVAPNEQLQLHLNAMLLPSLRRVTIKVPAAIGASSTLVLGPHHLYMIGGQTGDLYQTSSPLLTGAVR